MLEHLGVLLPLLHGPQQQAGGHHHAAREPREEEQAAQQRIGEARDVQAVEHAARLQRGLGRLVERGGDAFAGDGVEAHRGLLGRQVHAFPALEAHAGVGVVGQVDHHAAHRSALPLRTGLRHQGREVHHGGALPRRLDVTALHRVEDLAEHRLLAAMVLVRGLAGPGHVHEHQRHQPGVRDHEVVGQRQHRGRVVRIEPRALALLRPEGEEVLEDALVRDDAADDCREHEHGAEAHDPARPQRGHVVQVEVQAVEELAAARLARIGQRLAAGRVQRGVEEAAARRLLPRLGLGRRRLPEHAYAGLALGGQGDEPALGLRTVRLQMRDRVPQRLFGRHLMARGGMQLGLGPEGDLAAEVGGRAAGEHQEQHPADQQARPGVQPRHRLAEAFFHAKPPRSQISAPSTPEATKMPPHARQALRVAKTNITATT
ncbi:Uncharacterised protein [Xylophilus ampelinus]|nr:Uncharacterised protein [Xylophilus ampelinus]